MTDLSEREQRIKEAFSFKTDEAFELWVEQGCPIFEESPDSPDLLWDDGYRVRTDEDRRLAKEAAEEQRRRYEAGEMEPTEALMYSTLNSYRNLALDMLFSAQPLLFHLQDTNEPT